MPLSKLSRLGTGKHKSAQQSQPQQLLTPSPAPAPGPGPSSSSSLHGSDHLVELLVCENPNNTSSTGTAELHHHTSRLGHKGPPNATAAAADDDDTIMNDFDQIQMSKPCFSYKTDTDNNAPVQHINRSSDSLGDRALSFKDSQHTLNQRYTSFSQRHLISSSRPNVSQLDRVTLFPRMKKIKIQDQEQRVLSSSNVVINFPHFADMVKPGLHGFSSKPNPELPVTKTHNNKDKLFAPLSAELSSSSQEHLAMSKSLEKPHQVGQDTTKLVVASSACSANTVDRASNDPNYSTTTNYNESKEYSEYRIGSGSKRSRAAEVHNLSERRRRDRINEKMRALQELIPNCNKVDKASMLDEAIEYLKTLQLQVQMMSMGHGACMNSMNMARFSPMGIGMGYGSMQIPIFPMATVSQFGMLNANPMANPSMFGSQALIRTTGDTVQNAEEDEKLLNHITKHGHGCWSSVPKLAGLQRCGKSCRLRWINYLRPDLKRGAFSCQEESLIVELHSGRTDNEIKNLWNSCLKKKLRQRGIDPNTHKPLSSLENQCKSSIETHPSNEGSVLFDSWKIR